MLFPSVPPHRLVLLSSGGGVTGPVLGPEVEGGILRVTCRAEGGQPAPRVVWWLSGHPLDDSKDEDVVIASTLSHTQNTVSNTLTIEPLQRRFFNVDLRCTASNTNLTAPVQATVTIDMICKHNNEKNSFQNK